MSFSDSKWIYFLAILGFCKLETEEMLSKTYPQKRCVANYFLDFDNICKECPPGIFGMNCSQKCPSSTYGQFCAKLCQCPPDRCDKRHGCEDIVLEKEENSGLCVSKDGELECCLSFYKTNNTCAACPAGTYNNNCSDPCPPGYYGELCSKVCDCSEASCDKVHGCSQKVCPAGTYNNNCSDPCPPGYYGELCSKVCDCPEDSCDKVHGCSQQVSGTEVPLNMIIFAGSITLVFLLIMTILFIKFAKLQRLRRHAPLSNDLTDVAVYSEVKG
ncbi:multiple epidermal growth factor-like domains protein 10 isoform X5 [Saccostrea cucullata]|uniref:multiple epidermal growth factor-like domains protein 10 isoform X5 n=1 Tax=Saccostrea cuccullata TaxID=36930 RepID=UPI002ED56FF3